MKQFVENRRQAAFSVTNRGTNALYGVSESSVKAHFRVTLSVSTFAVATVPLLVFITYRDPAIYGSRVTIS